MGGPTGVIYQQLRHGDGGGTMRFFGVVGTEDSVVEVQELPAASVEPCRAPLGYEELVVDIHLGIGEGIGVLVVTRSRACERGGCRARACAGSKLWGILRELGDEQGLSAVVWRWRSCSVSSGWGSGSHPELPPKLLNKSTMISVTGGFLRPPHW